MIIDLKELKDLDKKYFILKNINGDSLGILQPTDISLPLRYNGMSELSFKIYKDLCPYYDLLTSYRRIEVQDVGLFIIDKPQIFNDGATEYKVITAKSFEVDINRKSVPLLQSTFKFYTQIPSDAPTIMDIIMSYLPNWTIKEVDSLLWDIYRTFDLSDKPLYDLIQNEISQSYGCVFEYNTLTREISVKAYENVPKKTDIYVSFNNLIQDLGLTEKTEELFTALEVKGSNIDINLVSPLGNVIYNFNHFLNTEGFMSNELKQAVLDWQDLIETQQPIYSNYLTQRRNKLSELITLQTELTELKNQLKALEIVRDALLDSGLNATDKNTEVKAKRVEITNKQTVIDNKQTEINTIDSNLKTIQNTLAINKYFTESQFLELEQIIIQTSVTDDEFVVTSQDSELDKQNTAQDLYDKYKKKLDDSSNLKFEFSTNLVDIINLKEYEIFTNQLSWGSQITMEVNDKKELAYPMLLGLDITLDNDNIDIKYIFSTEVKLSDKALDYDFSNEVSNMSNKMAGDSISWGEFTKVYRNDVDNLFKVGLNADLIEVKNAENQEVTFGTTGLMGKKLLESGLYSDEQWKFINNKLLFTDNNWNSAKLAIGLITNPDGTKSFGYNGETVYGNLIAGNNLVIKNANNSFIVDGNSAVLTNASLTIENTKNKILLDPTVGIKFQKKDGTIVSDLFYFDDNGNLAIKGSITAGSTITGSTVIGSLIKGGEIYIGGSQTASDCNFGVTEAGKILGLETVNGLFKMNKDGYAVFDGGIKIGDVLTVNPDGSIVWASHDPTIATAQNTADSALSDANSAYTVASLAGTNITKLSNGTYTGGTFIDGKKIEAPEIYGGKISAIDMFSSKFYGVNADSAYLKIGGSSNLGDLGLFRGGTSSPIFQVFDGIETIDLFSHSSKFLATTGNQTYSYGVWNFSTATSINWGNNAPVARFGG